jgi:nitrite reductase (NO-forming)
VTVAGAAAAAAAVTWHGVQLWRRLRSALPGRFRVTIRYYLCAAACMPVGATFGVLLARQPPDPWHSRLLVAHSLAMALGWLGLTVLGTLVTLWPTLLRAKIDDRAESLARQALPLLIVSLGTAVTASLMDVRPLISAALLAYAVGLLWWGRALLAPARRSAPRRFAPVSAAAALAWLVGTVVGVAVLVLVAPGWAAVGEQYDRVAAALAAGFALQLMLAALSHLVPGVLGGGPSAVRAGLACFERGAPWRVVALNAGVGLWLLPLPAATRVVAAVSTGLATAAFLPLVVLSVRESVRARSVAATALPAPGGRATLRDKPFWSSTQLPAALSVLALAIAVSLGLPGGGAAATAGGVTPSGHTTTVRVVADAMRFSPSSVTVPRGDRLVVELTNRDTTTTHDLVLASGAQTPRLAPGATARLDAGVISQPVEGWCSVVGHRQMGMVLHVLVSGAGAGAGAGAVAAEETGRPDAASMDAGFTAYDPVLPALTAARTHRVTLTVEEQEDEVAPGRWQRRWTYDGRSPGPTLRGRVGDVFEVTLVNHGSMGHSVDFHAGVRAPDDVMRTVPPGARLTYRFTATRAGIWLYHCATMPMSAHIAAGLFGAVVIEPPGLPEVDHSYLLVQSETYLGPSTAKGSASEVDAARARADTPDVVSFNGTANQYDATPLTVRAGERVRFWVLDAGPNRATSFHVVGAQFDAVWAEGAWVLPPGTTGGSQSLSLGAAQGGFVDTVFPEPGHYSFVDHAMADVERGAHGTVVVTP